MISYRGSGYVQDEWKTTLKDSSTLGFNLGIRGTYWDFNEELNISPRTQLLYRPSWEKKYALDLHQAFIISHHFTESYEG